MGVIISAFSASCLRSLNVSFLAKILVFLAITCLGLAFWLRNTILGAALALLAGFSLGLMQSIRIASSDARIIALKNQTVKLCGTVVDDVVLEEKTTKLGLSKLSFKTQKSSLQSAPQSLAFASLARTAQKLERSDRVCLRGKIRPGFNKYAGFLWRPTFISVNKPDPPD